MSRQVLGRPPLGESREKLTLVGFKADQETLTALARLIKDAEADGQKRAKSAVIRRAIVEAASRMVPKGKR